jgi:hypothetical protein
VYPETTNWYVQVDRDASCRNAGALWSRISAWLARSYGGLCVALPCLTRHASPPLVTHCSQKNLDDSADVNSILLYDRAMTGQATAMHVARIRSSHTDKQGRRREYESAYLRRTYRDGGKVRHETLASLSGLPGHVVDALAPAAGQQLTIARSLPHGHVAAVHAMARKLGLPALLGPAGPHRDLALALVISRVVAPGSKLSTLAWQADTTLGPDLGIDDATTDEAYAAMDWLVARQDAIESRLASRR